jgi:hypothetical protein
MGIPCGRIKSAMMRRIAPLTPDNFNIIRAAELPGVGLKGLNVEILQMGAADQLVDRRVFEQQ